MMKRRDSGCPRLGGPGDLVGFIADTRRPPRKSCWTGWNVSSAKVGFDGQQKSAMLLDYEPGIRKGEDSGGWTYAHNPFSMPKWGHESDRDTDLRRCVRRRHDLVWQVE